MIKYYKTVSWFNNGNAKRISGNADETTQSSLSHLILCCYVDYSQINNLHLFMKILEKRKKKKKTFFIANKSLKKQTHHMHIKFGICSQPKIAKCMYILCSCLILDPNGLLQNYILQTCFKVCICKNILQY